MKRSKLVGKFVVCIRNEECEDLEPRKLYRVLPDAAAAADGYRKLLKGPRDTRHEIISHFPQILEPICRRL
jgi:hypothetical protein